MFLACSPGLPFLTFFSEISPWGDTASHGLLVSGPFPVGGLDVGSGKSPPPPPPGAQGLASATIGF